MTGPTIQSVPIDAPESDEGETKDSDGGTPAPLSELTTTGTKVKKNKKSKKKHKKKTTSGHSSVRIFQFIYF
jgi:hypothetical protein